MQSKSEKDKDAEKTNLAKQTSQIIFAVSLYWVVSISMVFINKYLLSSKDLKFEAPLFVTWYQCFVSVLICAFLSGLASQKLITFPDFSIDLKIAREILPLSCIFVGMISFNNLCLKNVSISFYMVVRSLTTVFNVILTYIFFGDKTSRKAVGCCAIIVVGFLLGIDQEKGLGGVTFKGVFFGISASLCVALNAIYTKKSLKVVDDNVWKLTLYNNFNACFIFLPFIIIFGEMGEIMSFPLLFDTYFIFTMTIGGVLGFSMGYVTSLQIKATSPLTHNVSGTAKAYAQTLLGVVYFSEVKTGLWWISNCFVLLGAALYSHVRGQEMKNKNKVASMTLPEKQPGLRQIRN